MPGVPTIVALQVCRKCHPRRRLPVGRHVVNQPRGEANEVTSFREEVLAMVEWRHGLKVPLFQVLLIIIHWRSPTRIDKGDWRGCSGCSQVNDARGQGSLMNMVSMAPTIARIHSSPEHNTIGPLVIWEIGNSCLLGEISQGTAHQSQQKFEIPRIGVHLRPPLLSFGALELAFTRDLVPKKFVVQIVWVHTWKLLPKFSVFLDADITQTLGEALRHILEHIH
mmetsp:Transcript_72221/g.182070  ORF Transcript_72221/g.182070 Transcript_72221/m.182070 type:complete len:223 (+) Transcript_72221:203-871(+)